jgi:hypothetical protein
MGMALVDENRGSLGSEKKAAKAHAAQEITAVSC